MTYHESIHITIEEDESGTITTKSGDEPRETTEIKILLLNTKYLAIRLKYHL